ncbi:MAG: F0F1 ATP synthase subunit epsilon, partial [Corynebacterium sp.]|nr:F0F1 ATP synthase subunit epsilon [Corynebacterium sp.]
ADSALGAHEGDTAAAAARVRDASTDEERELAQSELRAVKRLQES